MPLLAQDKDDMEYLARLKRDFVHLENNAMGICYHTCPAGDAAITQVEAQISALDNQRAKMEQTLAFVLVKHEEDHKYIAELERQLDDVKMAKQSLDKELNVLVSNQELELEAKRVDKNQKLSNVRAECKFMITKACKDAVLHECQMVAVATSVVVLPMPVEH